MARANGARANGARANGARANGARANGRGPYFMVGITNEESSLMPSGQRAVMVLILV